MLGYMNAEEMLCSIQEHYELEDEQLEKKEETVVIESNTATLDLLPNVLLRIVSLYLTNNDFVKFVQTNYYVRLALTGRGYPKLERIGTIHCLNVIYFYNFITAFPDFKFKLIMDKKFNLTVFTTEQMLKFTEIYCGCDGKILYDYFEKINMVYLIHFDVLEEGGELITGDHKLICEDVGDGKSETLIGNFNKGILQGHGLRIDEKGITYDGYFLDGKLHGENCKITFADGTILIGTFINGKFTEGIQEYPNGKIVKGRFDNGLWVNPVTIITEKYKYVGPILDGVYHGLGTLEITGGATFEGVFNHGYIYGNGTKTESNGTAYTGHFEHRIVDGVLKLVLNGRVQITYLNGAFFVGTFDSELNAFSGTGTFTDTDGKVFQDVEESDCNTGVYKMYIPNSDTNIRQGSSEKRSHPADSIPTGSPKRARRGD